MFRLILIAVIAPIVMASCAEDGAVSEESPNKPVTWNELTGVFSSNGCYGCHPATGTSLDYAPLINGFGTCSSNGGKLVEIGDRAQSCLWLSVTGQEGSNMSGTAPFSSVATEKIGRWVDEGASGPP